MTLMQPHDAPGLTLGLARPYLGIQTLPQIWPQTQLALAQAWLDLTTISSFNAPCLPIKQLSKRAMVDLALISGKLKFFILILEHLFKWSHNKFIVEQTFKC